jgi:hypothetical protein
MEGQPMRAWENEKVTVTDSHKHRITLQAVLKIIMLELHNAILRLYDDFDLVTIKELLTRASLDDLHQINKMALLVEENDV